MSFAGYSHAGQAAGQANSGRTVAEHTGAGQAGAGQTIAGQTIDQFFASFTDEWVAKSPELATLYKYFTGDKQDQLERQLSPMTQDQSRAMIAPR